VLRLNDFDLCMDLADTDARVRHLGTPAFVPPRAENALYSEADDTCGVLLTFASLYFDISAFGSDKGKISAIRRLTDDVAVAPPIKAQASAELLRLATSLQPGGSRIEDGDGGGLEGVLRRAAGGYCVCGTGKSSSVCKDCRCVKARRTCVSSCGCIKHGKTCKNKHGGEGHDGGGDDDAGGDKEDCV
jgi:hypothetical protein